MSGNMAEGGVREKADYRYRASNVTWQKGRMYVISDEAETSARPILKLEKPVKARVDLRTSSKVGIKRLAHTVRFGMAEAVISDTEMEKLMKTINALKGAEAENIKLTGFTDALGTQGYNNVLALERANTVARLFRQAGLEQASVSGKGKCCYIGDEAGAANRRVEIRATVNKNFK